MNNDQVHDELVKWLRSALGLTVIQDRQGIERPALPYGMTDLANWREIHQHETTLLYEETGATNSEGNPQVGVTPQIEMEWVFLFFVYGNSPDTYTRRLQSTVHVRQAQQPLLDLGLHIHEISTANSIPELVGERWEPRSQVNISVRGVTGERFDTEVIDDFAINVTGERA